MAEFTAGELDSLPVPLDFGPVLKSATQGGSKRHSKKKNANGARLNGGGKNGDCREWGHTLTKKHFSVKHLYKCEQSHRWQWVPEKRLCSLWHSLSDEERARVVQTHERDQLTPPFCEDLKTQMHAVECYASESSKGTLASMIWCDQSGLALFKRIFIIAVEQNHPMVIDMEVIAAVDAVIQDFCASVIKMRQKRWLPWSFILGILLLIVFIFWLYDSSWTWLVCLVAMGVALHCICRSLPPLDPRSFAVGTDLWVQYREREHVRLMWMSATTRVFEVRLLRILERRRRLAKQAEAQQRQIHQLRSQPNRILATQRLTNGANALENEPKVLEHCREEPARSTGAVAAPAPKKKQLGPKRQMRQRRPAPQCEEKQPLTEKHDEQCCKVEEHEDEMPSEDAPIVEDENVNASIPVEPVPEEEEAPQLGELALMLAKAEAEEAEEGDEFNNEDGDEIDAEFARRVQEHFQNRRQAAGKDLHSQTAMGNQILKTLCEKLKTELERATTAPS